MSKSYSDKTVLIWDKGLFVWLASKFVGSFKEVLYYTPWDGAFPHPSDVAIGEGIDGVTRIYDFWDYLDEADLVVFPDVGNGDMQEFLRNQGHRVWGSAGAQYLELDRIQSRNDMRELGIEVPPTERILGIEALKEFVDKTEDRWIKISLFRGAFETTHHVKPFITDEWLKVISRELGPQADHLEFVVEEGVPGIEVGWDAHCIDGKYPKLGYCGLEIKDKAIAGKLVEFSALPDKMREAYEKLSPILSKGEYRNYFSLEMRIDKKGDSPVVIDPCCRFGSPCTEAWAELVDNLAEVFWEGADGTLVEVKPAAKYAALAVINSEWAVTNWTPIDVPEAVRPFVKMKCLTVIDDKYYYVPGDLKMSEIGVVVGTGDTMDEAIEAVKAHSDEISGYKIDIKTDALDNAMEEIEKVEKLGLSVG